MAGLALGACSQPKDDASGADGAANAGTAKTPASVATQSSKASPKALPKDVTAAIERSRDTVFPALVNIQVISVSFWGGKETKGGSTGSGTIITPDGLVVTNHHVVEDGRSFRVTLADKREARATLVGEDPMTDLAVLRLNMQDLGESPLPTASFGDSDALRPGDYVMAMGAPFGLNRSISLGIVSNTERVFTGMSGDDIADQEFDFDTSSDIFTRWLQHDALILPGNSGGPLVNLQGEIVGVNTRGGSGLGFANPSNFARKIVDSLIANGEVIRSSIGANFKSVKRAGFAEGVLINSVNEDGPADRAGLKAGDVIVALDGTPVSARFPEEIPLVLRAIAEKPVGTAMQITYKRGDTQGTSTVTTEKLMREQGDRNALRVFGLSVSQITARMARNRRLDNTEGVLVIGIRGGGPAEIAEPSLGWGDIIKSIDGKPIRTLQDMLDVYQAIASQDPLPEFVRVEFDRNGKNQLTLLKPRNERPDDPPRELPKAWIGIATQPVLRDLARQLSLPNNAQGFRITRVYPRTLAQQAGLRVGDIITKLNGEAVSPRTLQDAGMLVRNIRKLPISGAAKLELLRDGQTVTLDVPLERSRLTPEEALRDSNRDFELTVRELTFFDRDDMRWDEDVQGVMVQSVERAGWAGLAGLIEGDVIQRINEFAVTDLATYRKAMDAIAKQQPARVAFFVLRGNRTQFNFAEPEWKPMTAEEAAKAASTPAPSTP
jgi:serine protease Do